MADLHWSLKLKVLLDLRYNVVESHCVQDKDVQTYYKRNISVPDTTTKNTTKHISTD